MISVIVPVYNVEKFLRKCLDSIMDQSYKNFEVICIDDGATDGSLDILNEYIEKDSRFKLFRQSNKGLSGARNTGLKYAKGDYIYFLDSDDYIHPDVLKITHYYITKYNLDFVSFKYKVTDNDNSEYEDYSNFKNSKVEVIDSALKSYLTQSVKMHPNVWSKLYTRESIGQLTFQEGVKFEDLIFTPMYLSKNVKGIKIPFSLCYYRHNPNSIINSEFTASEAKDYLRVFEYIHSYFKDTKYYDVIKKTILPKVIKTIIKKTNKSKNKNDLIRIISPKIIFFYKMGMFSLRGLTFSQQIKLFSLIYKSRGNSSD